MKPPPLSVFELIDWVAGEVRHDALLSEALDRYANDGAVDNVRCRWLPTRQGYEVTLYFDASALMGEDK